MSDTVPSPPLWDNEPTTGSVDVTAKSEAERIAVIEQALFDINRTHERVGKFVAAVMGMVLVGSATVVLLVYQNKERIHHLSERVVEHNGEAGHAAMIERAGEIQAQQREDRAQVFTELAAIRSTLDEIKAQLNRQDRR